MNRTTSPWIDAVADEKRYPALSSDERADAVIVGAGIVGVLSAWHLRRRGLSVVLLEKNHVATGDTGATTGFLTRVADTSHAGLLKRYGKEFLRRLYAASSEAQKTVFDLVEEKGIDCDLKRHDSFWGSYREGGAGLNEEFEAIRSAETGAEWLDGGRLAGTSFKEAIRIPREGSYNVRAFLFGLLEKMKGGGFSAYEESEVLEVEVGEKVVVKTEKGSVTATKAVLATGRPIDAFAELRELLHPYVTYVMTAEYRSSPLPDGNYWDTEDPYFYYRKIGEKTLMLGGADLPAGKADEAAAHAKLEAFLPKLAPGPYETLNRWSGSIFHTDDGLPYVFAHPHEGKEVVCAMGFGGNGMVFGSLAALAAADLAAGEATDRTLLLSPARANVQIPKRALRAAETKLGFRPLLPAEKLDKEAASCAVAGGRKIALFKADGKYYAIDNSCTHQGGSLCDGTFEGRIIQCPLHGAKFDVTTGEVKGPPASRPVRAYRTRVVDGMLEAEVPVGAAPEPTTFALSETEKREKTWRSFFLFLPIPLALWLVEFAAQYFWLIPGEIGGSLVRSFALTGATLISAALLSSALFKLFPPLAVHWRIRRRLGVSGVIFITFHILAVMNYFFMFDARSAFYTLNPLENPIVFGAIAYALFFVMAATSTDWAVEKLTQKNWKRLHRVAYFAYWAAIFHFMTIDPELLKSPPGIVLVALAAAALFGQLFWYLRIAGAKRFMTIGGAVGAVVILLYAGTAYLVYRKRQADLVPPPPPSAAPAATAPAEDPLEISIEKMRIFMETQGGDPDISEDPIEADHGFEGEMMRAGEFVNLNYMTSGGARLERTDEGQFVVFDERFSTPNGPDLQIYLTQNDGPTTREDVRRGIALGKLKSTTGKQVYSVPASVDVESYGSVTIHCRAFNVPWSYAPLR